MDKVKGRVRQSKPLYNVAQRKFSTKYVDLISYQGIQCSLPYDELYTLYDELYTALQAHRRKKYPFSYAGIVSPPFRNS